MSVNWHLWRACNYACTFCFAHFGDSMIGLSLEDALQVARLLALAGVRKITFAGGEPILCPYLPELIAECKQLGMTTMVATNASRLTPEFLARVRGFLDWVTISIDSGSEETEKQLGRGTGTHVRDAVAAAERTRRAGLRVKMNSVVTALNWQEDMTDLVRRVNPERWKVFQVLPIAGENDEHFAELEITKEQFQAFLDRHRHLSPVGEDNDAMTESYLMIDPSGRFFQNTGGRLSYSERILDVGVEETVRQVGWDIGKFVKRGGKWDWREV